MKKENLHQPGGTPPVRRTTRPANSAAYRTYRTGASRPSASAEQTTHHIVPNDRPMRTVRSSSRSARPVRRRGIPPLRLAVYICIPVLLGVALIVTVLGSIGGSAGKAPVSSAVSSGDLPAGAVVSGESGAGHSKIESDVSAEETLPTREEMRAYLEANPDQNTEGLLLMLDGDEEAFEFVVHYAEKYHTKLDCTLTEEDLQIEEDRLLPLFMQWDERWGYTDYGGYVFGTNACGPTTLSMVAVALLDDPTLNPSVVAEFAERNGYAAAGGNGSEWALMSEGGELLGMTVEEIYPMESMIRSALNDGHPVVCIMGSGVFTTGGHYVVICGTDGDNFLVNDCNSYTRSAQSWAFEEFGDQISCLWEFSYEP